MKTIINFLIALTLFISGLVYASDKPEIVPYTGNSMQEFLNGLQPANNTVLPNPFANGEWTTYTFILGDTVTTFDVINARRVDFVFADSSLAGVDTMGIKLRTPSPITTGYLYSSIYVSVWNDTANISNTPADSLAAGTGITAGYSYLPLGNSTITGTFYIYRKNANGYAAKTRSGWKFE